MEGRHFKLSAYRFTFQIINAQNMDMMKVWSIWGKAKWKLSEWLWGSASLPQSAADYIYQTSTDSPCCKAPAWVLFGKVDFFLQVHILGPWQVLCWKAGEIMGELREREFLGGGVKVKCITRGQPIGWQYPIALHRLHSAPPAEAYLAPFIMHAHHPPCTGLSWLVLFDNSAQLYFFP